MTELKSCPFCGGEARYLPLAVTVQCRSCYCHTPSFDEPTASAAWNTRAPVVTPPGWVLVPDDQHMTDEQAEEIARLANCCGGIAYDIYRAALLAGARAEPGCAASEDCPAQVGKHVAPSAPRAGSGQSVTREQIDTIIRDDVRTDIYGDLYGVDRATDAILALIDGAG